MKESNKEANRFFFFLEAFYLSKMPTVPFSFFLVIGLFSRIMAVAFIITMLVIIFIVHQADSFGDKELAYFYLINYIIVFLSGSGNYSVDKLLLKK